MNLTIFIAFVSLMAIYLGIKYGGPRLDASPPPSGVPKDLELGALGDWLRQQENQFDVIEGAEARLLFADPSSPNKTALSVLHLHGFSACRQETAPIAEQLAGQLGANLVEVRLAGHGLKDGVMQASAEDWLQTVTNAFDLAHRIGDEVIMIGTSTGAPLGCWAAKALADEFAPPRAMVYMAPNFGIKQPFAWLLTLPGSTWFVPRLLGKHRTWVAESEAVARYWSTSYPIQAVIEMQKVVRWFEEQESSSWDIPLGMMLGDLDPTISSKKALATLDNWSNPMSRRLSIPNETILAEHVFAGDICGPNLTQHCVDSFEQFIRSVMVHDPVQR